MSLIFIEGFDHYNEIREKWNVGSTFDNPTFVSGRFGGQALKKQFQNSAESIVRDIDAQTEVIFGCAVQFPGLPSFASSFFRINSEDGVTRLSVEVDNQGIVSVVAGGVTSYSHVGTVTTGTTWHYIECRYIARASAGLGGVAEIRVDGAVVASIDGASNATTTGLTDDIRGFGFIDNQTNSPQYLFDDMYILNGSGSTNNAYLGDVRVSVLYAKEDGIVTNFSPLSGVDNYPMVDEAIMDGEVSYVEAGLLGSTDDFVNQTFADLAVDPGDVYGVQVANGTRRTATGGLTFKNEMTIGGVRYSDEVDHSANTGTYFIETYVSDTDPSTGLDWTELSVAGVGSGYTITSTEV